MTTNAKELISLDKKHVWHHITQHKVFENSDPIIFSEAKGMRIKDVNGKEYLDGLSGGVWSVNVGYGRKQIAQAVAEQLEKFCYFAGTFGNVPATLLAKQIIDKMPGMSRVYFSNSGSEANEKAFKIVRQISELKYNGKKNKILYRNRDYHGTTITTLAASGHDERRKQYGPFTPGFVEFPAANPYRNPYGLDQNDPALGKLFAEELEKVILAEGADTVGAVIIETVTAGGGALVPPDDYFKHVSEICKKHKVLVIIDEVVCGFGRTGKWFGYQNYGFTPDIVTMAKGMASGYAAISCTVTTEEVFQDFIEEPSHAEHYFRDISTFGGCTGGQVAAIESMKIIEDEKLIENTFVMGAYLRKLLTGLKDKYDAIGDVRGIGLYYGIELVKDRATKEPIEEAICAKIVTACLQKGVIIGRTARCVPGFNNTLCIAPSLITTEKEIDEIVSIVDSVMKEILV